jgi:hypothetical protein
VDDYYDRKEKKARGLLPSRALGHLPSAHSGSAGRGALLAFHPLLDRCLGVADGATQLDIGRAIAGQATLGQPGHAEVQVPRRLFRGQQRIVLQGFGCRGHSVLWFDLDGQMMKEVLPQNSGLFPQKTEPD